MDENTKEERRSVKLKFVKFWGHVYSYYSRTIGRNINDIKKMRMAREFNLLLETINKLLEIHTPKHSTLNNHSLSFFVN